MHAVVFAVDLVYSVFSRHEPDGVLLNVDELNKAVLLVARRSDDLPQQIASASKLI